jgi:hypothetical protein
VISCKRLAGNPHASSIRISTDRGLWDDSYRLLPCKSLCK